jgi:hypothetical protein
MDDAKRISIYSNCGATKLPQLIENLQTISVHYSADQINRLNEASKFELGFPHDFFNEDGVRTNNFGGFYEQVEKRS